MKQKLLMFLSLLMLVAVDANAYGKNEQNFIDAISNAVEGGTVTLTDDVELTSLVIINKSLTIDLNGHNIEATNYRAFYISYGDVIFTGTGTISANKTEGNMTFEDSSSVIRIGDNAEPARNVSLTIGEGVTVSSNHCYGISVFGKGTKETVTINGKVKVTGSAPAVSGNGSAGYEGTTIIINGEVTSENDNAIYNPQAGTLTINGLVKGKGGIEAKAGATTVEISEHAVIEATAETTNHEANGNGCSTSGYAIAVVENAGYAGNANVTIKGGTIKGQIAIVDDDSDATNNTGSISISGGTFSVQPSDQYIAEGYKAVQNESLWNVVSSSEVAKIGETKYASLEAAIAAASNNDELSLLADINTDKQIEIADKEITINLSGHKIAYTGSETLKSGVLLVHNGAGLTVKGIEEGSEITGGNNAYAAIALTKAGDNDQSPAKLTVESGSFSGDQYAIVGNGGRHNTEINIKGGVFTGTHENDNLAIYHPQDGQLTISGGKFTGNNTAIEIRAGEVNISGGTFKATASPTSVAANGNGTTTYGAAIGIAQHNTQKDIKVTITGGEFEGYTALSVLNPQNNATENVNVTITNGTFNGSLYGVIAQHGTMNIEGGTIKSTITERKGAGVSAEAGIINIKGGSISSTKNVGVSVDKCTLNISGTADISGVEGAVITGYGTGATINIENGTFKATDNAVIAGNGTNREGEPNKFNISGGTFTGGITSSGYVACGVYAPWKDEFNITGGTFNITGGAGVVARAGMVNVSDNVVINCTGNVIGKVGDSRVVVPCSPIVFDSQANYPAMTDASMITVTGGTFTSDAGVPVAKAILAKGETNRRVVLLGGTYSSEPGASYLGAGTKATESDGKYTVSYSAEDANGVTAVVDEDNIKVSSGETTLTGDQKAQAVDAIKAVVDNAAVTSSVTNANEAVSTEGTTDDGKTIVDLLKDAVTDSEVANNIGSTNISTSISVTVKSAEVETSGSGVAVTKMVFEIKPVATVVVNGNPVASVVVPNKLITQKIKFRLPVDKNTDKECVEIFHTADGASERVSLGYFAILEDEAGNKYVELERENFSTYEVELVGVGSMQVIYVENGGPKYTSVAMAKTSWGEFLDNYPNAIAIVGSENSEFASSEGIKNVLVKYITGSTKSYNCPNFVLTDLKEFYTPVEFTAIGGSYSRTPNAASYTGVKFNSVCLPFEISSAPSPTAQLLTFSRMSEDQSTVYFNEVSKIEAGVPCLIHDEGTTEWNFNFSDTKILASPILSGNMKGTFVNTPAYGSNEKYLSVGKDNKFGKLNGNLSPFRSCLSLETAEDIPSTQNMLFSIGIEGEGTTNVDRINVEGESTNDVYNLNGVKVGASRKGLPKGIYIQNGKTIIVK